MKTIAVFCLLLILVLGSNAQSNDFGIDLGFNPKEKAMFDLRNDDGAIAENRADLYLLGTIGSHECPKGAHPIVDKTSCQEACKNLGLPEKQILGGSACYKDFTNGCYQNGHNGRAALMICKVVPDAKTNWDKELKALRREVAAQFKDLDERIKASTHLNMMTLSGDIEETNLVAQQNKEELDTLKTSLAQWKALMDFQYMPTRVNKPGTKRTLGAYLDTKFTRPETIKYYWRETQNKLNKNNIRIRRI